MAPLAVEPVEFVWRLRSLQANKAQLETDWHQFDSRLFNTDSSSDQEFDSRDDRTRQVGTGESRTSAAGENGVSLSEARIYLDQTRGECGTTNQDCFGVI